MKGILSAMAEIKNPFSSLTTTPVSAPASGKLASSKWSLYTPGEGGCHERVDSSETWGEVSS